MLCEHPKKRLVVLWIIGQGFTALQAFIIKICYLGVRKMYECLEASSISCVPLLSTISLCSPEKVN